LYKATTDNHHFICFLCYLCQFIDYMLL